MNRVKRISASVRATQNLVDLNDFAKGIEEAFKDSGETLPEDYIVDVSNHYEESYPQLKEYFDTHKHDVVLTGYDKEAVAVVNAAPIMVSMYLKICRLLV